MMLALGAATSVLDTILNSSAKPQPAECGNGPNPAWAECGSDTGALFARNNAETPAGTNTNHTAGGASISAETMNALLAAQSQSATTFTPMNHGDALKHLLSQIDADGDGKISQSEFQEALGAGGTNLTQADDVFGKLDKDGDGSVSLDELASALMPEGDREHENGRTASGSGHDPLLQALDGASRSTVTNADGSTTTSLNYADGSTVTMTQPAAASNASAVAMSSYNFLEQLIQRQANALAAQASSSLSVSV